MKKNVALIFGISGQDGAYLAKFLLEKGYEVYGTSRDAELNNFSLLENLKIKQKVSCHSVTLTDFRSLISIIKSIKPTEIYNLSGQSSVSLSFSQPIETLESISNATLNVLEAIRFSGIEARFYNACSSESFGNVDGNPANEETPFNPRSPYGVAKAAAFWNVASYRQSYDIFACSGILFNHESPLRAKRFVTRKISIGAAKIALGETKKLYLGDLSVKRDWGWAPEYVEAMWLMLQEKKAEDFVIATGKLNSLKDFVKEVFEFFNLNWKDHVLQDKSLLRPSDINYGYGNPNKAMKKLNWQATIQMNEIAKKMAEYDYELLLKQ